MILILIFLIGLCWGSFLNVLAYRLLHGHRFFTHRSFCPSCHATIAWYDNIPVVSWIVLRGKCRRCTSSISWLYPFIELTTALVVTGLFIQWYADFDWCQAASIGTLINMATAKPLASLIWYFVFSSALIAATRTDLDALVIPQIFSIWLVPLGFIAAATGGIAITFFQSVIGACIGYGILWIVAWFFKKCSGQEGMGVGDMELLALIGSFCGPIGVWVSLLVGSFAGMILGGVFVLLKGRGLRVRIPFGPFLSLGALAYVFGKQWIIPLLFP